MKNIQERAKMRIFRCCVIFDPPINAFQTNYSIFAKKRGTYLSGLAIFLAVILLQFYYNTFSYLDFGTAWAKVLAIGRFKKTTSAFITTYEWFKSNKHNLTNLGEDENLEYSSDTPLCRLNYSALGPISVNKTDLHLDWVEKEHPDVRAGGFYSPLQCRPKTMLAILVPYRDREKNLYIFLYYIHRLLKKQLLQYRIFVIEQYGKECFNRGSLYNVGYIESQRFGRWRCLIFHDVDLIPLDERILYTCPPQPTHMSAAVEQFGFRLPYGEIFGGVTALTSRHYELVNGYSNLFWGWGGEDDDMFIRLKAKRLPVIRYATAIGRYASLPHAPSPCRFYNRYKLYDTKKRYQKDGLNSLKYIVVNTTKKNLYTHILVDINP